MIKYLIMIALGLFLTTYSFSQNEVKQITFYESDVRNPSFNVSDFFDPFVLFEVHSGDSINIHCMIYDAVTDTFIAGPPVTSDQFKNTNPIGSIIGNQQVVIYQSDRNGNWDILYRYLTPSGWSEAIEILASPADEQVPKLIEQKFSLNDTIIFVCRQDADLFDIVLVKFKDQLISLDGVFTGLEYGQSYSYSGMYLSRYPNQTGYFVAATEQTGYGSRLVYKYKPDGQTTWNNPVTIADSGKFANPVLFDHWSTPYIFYDNETNGVSNIFYRELNNGSEYIIDPEVTGNKFDFNLRQIDYITFGDQSDFWGAVYVYKLKIQDSVFIRVPEDELIYDFIYTRIDDASPAVGFVGINSPHFIYYALWEDSTTSSIQLFGKRIPIIMGDVNENDPAALEYGLLQNYPNPFNPSTRIRYKIPASAFVTIKVFDVLGNEMAVLVNEVRMKGEYEVEFDAGNLSSGVYVVILNSSGQSLSRKIMVLK